MNESARVTSIDALKEFRRALISFKQKAEEALTATAIEVQRALDHILNDQPKHYEAQRRKMEDAVTQARLDLNRRQISRVFGNQPDTTVQEMDLRKAKQRLEQVEAKLAAIRRWRGPLERAVMEYEGPAGQLASMLTVEIQNAIAMLERKADTLVQYTKLAAPEPPPLSAPALGGPAAPTGETVS